MSCLEKGPKLSFRTCWVRGFCLFRILAGFVVGFVRLMGRSGCWLVDVVVVCCRFFGFGFVFFFLKYKLTINVTLKSSCQLHVHCD